MQQVLFLYFKVIFCSILEYPHSRLYFQHIVSSLATSRPLPPPVTMTTMSPTSQAQSQYWRQITGTSQVIPIPIAFNSCFMNEIFYDSNYFYVDLGQF